MISLGEHLSLSRVKPPPLLSRPLLAYLHSGEMMRQAVPVLLRTGAFAWLFFYTLSWLVQWPAIYRELERWGLVRGFVAQLIALATAGLVVKITLLRASHLSAFPADDFVVLRTVAVLCRWLGEAALVYVVGMWVSNWLQPVGAVALALVGAGVDNTGVRVLSGAVSSLAVALVAPLFLVLYAAATTIDLALAIESNTRLERLGRS